MKIVVCSFWMPLEEQGKHVITLLLVKIKTERKIVIAAASSGIAATLLPRGLTSHSTFQLPLNLTSMDESICNIRHGSATAKLLRKVVLIVWDETTMAHWLT